MNANYRGLGYTKATVIVDRLSLNRFIGYIPTKGEYIIATKFENNGYGWTHYYREIEDIVNDLKKEGCYSPALEVLKFDSNIEEV